MNCSILLFKPPVIIALFNLKTILCRRHNPSHVEVLRALRVTSTSLCTLLSVHCDCHCCVKVILFVCLFYSVWWTRHTRTHMITVTIQTLHSRACISVWDRRRLIRLGNWATLIPIILVSGSCLCVCVCPPTMSRPSMLTLIGWLVRVSVCPSIPLYTAHLLEPSPARILIGKWRCDDCFHRLNSGQSSTELECARAGLAF